MNTGKLRKAGYLTLRIKRSHVRIMPGVFILFQKINSLDNKEDKYFDLSSLLSFYLFGKPARVTGRFLCDFINCFQTGNEFIHFTQLIFSDFKLVCYCQITHRYLRCV